MSLLNELVGACEEDFISGKKNENNKNRST